MQGAVVLRHERNRGKGAALRTGLAEARRRGFTHAISCDADGQHPPGELPNLLAALEATPEALILGHRDLAGVGAGPGSKVGRWLSNLGFRMVTGQRLTDTQTGYRVYPLDAVCDLPLTCEGFDFEIEVLVKAAWAGLELRTIPIDVIYLARDERVSHLHPMWDSLRVAWLDARFAFQRLTGRV